MAGRPTSYKPEYCQVLIDTMSAGDSLARVATKVGVTRKTLYNWMQEYPEFAEAFETGRDAALAYWEDIAKSVAIEGKGNAAVLNFQMKNRFRTDYQDSQSMSLSGGESPIQTENLYTVKFIMPEGTDE